VTLTAASTIIWFGPTASLETYLQGNARIHRAGQSNKTLVVRLVGSPVERKVYAALDSKELDMKRLMQLYDDVIKGD
jgi:SNF2 family DNA or RNA helicase